MGKGGEAGGDGIPFSGGGGAGEGIPFGGGGGDGIPPFRLGMGGGTGGPPNRGIGGREEKVGEYSQPSISFLES